MLNTIVKNWLEKSNNLRYRDKKKVAITASIKKANLYGDISVEDHVKLHGGITIHAKSSVVIGAYSSLNGPNVDIIAEVNHVTIGRFCSIARNVSIQEFNHDFEKPSTYYFNKNIFNKKNVKDIVSNGPIDIGHDVWIGTHSVVLSGTTIGNGAVIAANSVVRGEVPAYAIYGGSPAKFIKWRFEEAIIEKLKEIEWWNWSIEKIKANESFFLNKLTTESFDKIVNI